MGKESSVDLWMCANVTVRTALALGSGLTCHMQTSIQYFTHCFVFALYASERAYHARWA